MSATVLGIDIGTTSAKAGAFDADGNETGAAETAYPLLEPQPGWAVQDPAVVVDAVVGVIRTALADASAAGVAVAGLSFSTALHSLVGLDEHDRAITPLLTWADQRAAPQAERLRAERPYLHGLTGTPLHPMSPLTKLVWFREQEPELFARARRWCGVKELVVGRLTGEWVTDHSVASATGLMSLADLDWAPEALEVAGVTAAQLPRLAGTKHVLALTVEGARTLRADPGLPLVLGAGDGPLANLGVGAVRPGVAACSIGTSGGLRLVVERPVIDHAGRVFCYALTPGRWVVGGAVNNGGVVLQWAGDALAPELGEHSEEALLDLAAQAPPGSDGLLMLPYLLSERAPHWSTLPRGAYVGLTRAHRRGHLVRAALEGVCQQLALVLASLREAGNEIREIRATGGFARSPFWRRLLCDVLGFPIGFPENHHGSGFGAALLGMEALGIIETIDRSAELIQIDEVLEPDPDVAALYAAMLPTFEALYDALTPAFRALDDLERAPDPERPMPS
ncbi:MAG TPA: gluconokinase [Baekduia sp.]|jgi:gluconokinase|nr:gluconokinase [Baekduia sp.]